MTPWPVRETLRCPGRRQAAGLVLLLAVAVYCVAAGLAVQGCEIRLIELGTAASLINTVILGLLLSFRNSRRTSGGGKPVGCGASSPTTAATSPRNAPPSCRPTCWPVRASPVLVGFAEALKRHLRDESPRLRDLPGFEDEADDPPHVPLYLARRLFAVIAEWKRDGHLDPAVLWILDAHARGLLDVCGACEKIKTTPLSPSYKGLLRAGLVLNVLAEPWLSVPEIGFWGLPAFLLMCFFLFGVELIDSIVEEPFGRERDDLDLDRYCRTIREGVEASLPLAPKQG